MEQPNDMISPRHEQDSHSMKGSIDAASASDVDMISPNCIIEEAQQKESNQPRPPRPRPVSSISSPAKRSSSDATDVTAATSTSRSLSSSYTDIYSPTGGDGGGGGDNSLSSIRHHRRVHLLEQALQEGDTSLIHSLTVSPLNNSSSSMITTPVTLLEDALQEGDSTVFENLTVSPLHESSSSLKSPPTQLPEGMIMPVDEHETEQDQHEEEHVDQQEVPEGIAISMSVDEEPEPEQDNPNEPAVQQQVPGQIAMSMSVDEHEEEQQELAAQQDVNSEKTLQAANLSSTEQKRVIQFAPRLQKLKSKWCREELDENVWYNPEEIRAMTLKARSAVKRSSKDKSSYTEAVQAVFLDTCGAARFMKDNDAPGTELDESAPSSLSTSSSMGSFESRIGWDKESIQDLLSEEHRPRSLRGLECRTIPILKNYRTFHSQSVLAIQEQRRQHRSNESQNPSADKDAADPEVTARLIRAQSLRTSRPSRALARIFAQSDANEVAIMIRNELRRQAEQSDPSP
mmetsp:Transcript_47661/g.116066  ORF Transcript_47661/g.116066 Transcript_47661/m.116066 type:complete len:515 (-) Transcript_47661:181-1725(-)